MAKQSTTKQSQWSSQLGFILAATGATVGIGNIWKFPYLVGENGGGAFVLVYLICIFLIGVPIMLAEVLIGRAARKNPATAIADLAKKSNCSTKWGMVGWLTILSGFLVLSYYCVISGWALHYIYLSVSNQLNNPDMVYITSLFNEMTQSPLTLIFWHTVITGATTIVVAFGIEKGIENTIRFMLPSMVFLLIVLIIYAMFTGEFIQSLSFLFYPKFSELSGKGILIALGQSFFTLSLATGSILMYGAFVPKDTSIPRSVVTVAIGDTLVALLAGLAIFPIVFANSLEPNEGPALIFKTLALAFSNMPFGSVFATLFFIMLSFAAFSTTISLIEPTSSWLREKKYIKNRTVATILTGSIVWAIGLISALSFNVWQKVEILGIPLTDFINHLTVNFLLPIGGIGIAFFTAKKLSKKIIKEEIYHDGKKIYKTWLFVLTYISPAAISIILLKTTGVLDFVIGLLTNS